MTCPKCNDTGLADSGGVHPWGEPITIPCDCDECPYEITVFAMHRGTIADRGQEITGYDIIVTRQGDDDPCEEFDDLTKAKVDEILPLLEQRYFTSASHVGG